MSTKHTPGPWHVGKGSKCVVYDAEGWAVADAVTCHNRHNAIDANARLIAAAPDLLDALRRLCAVAVWDEDTDRAEFDAAISGADAAIAKAEGGAA